MQDIIYWKGGGTINKRFIQTIVEKIKKYTKFIDKKIILGIGIGMIIGSTLMLPVKFKDINDSGKIENKARAMGMEYPENYKVDVKGEEKND